MDHPEEIIELLINNYALKNNEATFVSKPKPSGK